MVNTKELNEVDMNELVRLEMPKVRPYDCRSSTVCGNNYILK